jgi:hypothetical protein
MRNGRAARHCEARNARRSNPSSPALREIWIASSLRFSQ